MVAAYLVNEIKGLKKIIDILRKHLKVKVKYEKFKG